MEKRKGKPMLQYEEQRHRVAELEKELAGLKDSLGLPRLREEVEMLEHKTAEPGFWDNMEEAQRITRRMANLKDRGCPLPRTPWAGPARRMCWTKG